MKNFIRYITELKDSGVELKRIQSKGLDKTYRFYISSAIKNVRSSVDVIFKKIEKAEMSHVWFGTNSAGDSIVMVEISFTIDGAGEKSKLYKPINMSANAVLNLIGSIQKATKTYQSEVSSEKIDFIFFSGIGGAKDKLYTILAKKISKDFIKKKINLGPGAAKFTAFLMPISQRAKKFTKGTGY